MSKRVLVHVGTPKTGTSYLQDVLFRNKGRLAEQGVLYPGDRFDAHFLAALDLMSLPWGGLEAEAVGAWDRLADQVRHWDGAAIISHEILATATRAQVAQALESLGHPDVEIHVVLTVRDLVRQIPAEWQENVKHRSELSYARFLEKIRDPERKGRIASWFWGVQEIPDILDRWAESLPPERVHVVTVPPPGGPPHLLWQRCVDAFGLTGLELDLHGERANPSLGVPETELVRRINLRCNRTIEPASYRPLVREVLAHRTLSRRVDSPRIALPPDVHPWAQALGTAWIEEIRARGYAVVGDLGDLIGPPATTTFCDPDRPDESQVADAALDAIRALLLENSRLLSVEQDLTGRVGHLERELDRAYLRPTYRLRVRVVRQLRANRPGRALLRAYRRVRGRSSRSA